jgi:hypothetical protein
MSGVQPARAQSGLEYWFIASGIHLDGPDETDLVVVPSFRGKESMCFESVEAIGWFWILRKAGERYQLVLKTRGNGLEVLKTKNKGFRNIQTGTLGQAGRFIPTVRFGFDGKAYRKYSKRTQESR